jgi:hypothetical protein
MIYLQSNNNKTLPQNFEVACALYGAIQSNRNYEFITYDEVKSGNYDHLIKTNLFVGSVEFMRLVFERINLFNVRLPQNSNRPSKIDKLENIRNQIGVFIKPLQIKLFTGFVLDGCQYPILDEIPQDTQILVYDAFKSNITTEWRLYIDRGEIIDSHCYSGDFKIMPDYEYIENIIINNKKLDFPSTYVIDSAVLENGECVIIEYNDMWAIGNYGLDNYTYLKLLTNRYFDIVRFQNSNYGI